MAKKNSEGRGKIEFAHVGIGTALIHNRLAVPVNQREYAWEEKHVNDLLRDFSNAIGQNKSSYFLGTVVLTTGDEVPEVADGQQRLATTTILLAAIRDYLFERGEDVLVNSIEQEFLFRIVRQTKETMPRLSLNVQDNQFFKNFILARPNDPLRLKATPGGRSHDRIKAAAEIARAHVESVLSQFSEGHKVAHLNAWLEFIENTAQIIMLSVPDDLDAFVMFETLNDRGLKTSQADLMKNYLFSAVDNRISEAQQKWASMTGAIESLTIEDSTLVYLRHLLSSLYGLTRAREVFERIKEKVAGKTQSLAFLDTLADYANDYLAILNPDHSKWNGYNFNVRSHIRTMNTFGVEVIRPLLLAVARHFTPKETEKAFRLFVCWTARFLIAGGARGGTIEEAYASRAFEVTQGKVTTAKQLADAMVDIVPTDAQFEAAFGTARVSKNNLARYYLRALELKKKGSPQPELIPNEDVVINLEHVLPENPGKGWAHIDPDVAGAVYRRLGNMVLLQAAKNSSIGNKSFPEKRAVLKSSAYLLTAEVGRESNWGVKEINERQKRMAALAVETWPIDVK
jgi:Protein of unknown function DUF262/Protein of unknown function (DUF1524)